MITRNIEKYVIDAAKAYPVVTITGPRQSGKTTLSKKCFPNMKYFNLEDPNIKEYAKTDPRGFLSSSDTGMVIDEIQNLPELLSYIQVIVDETNTEGQFILTGSQQFELMKGVSQSLAGRTSVVKLLPFSLSECNLIETTKDLDSLILKGFYPRIWDKKINPYNAYKDYFETYLKRDLRDIINIKDISLFIKFIKLCAGRVGQVFVASNIANDVGVSVQTISNWMSVLEASFIVYLLPPYYENIGKRLIKSPKLYFYDVGLACYLLQLEDKRYLTNNPIRGSLIENLVVIELLKVRYNQIKDSNLFFYRDKNKVEIDLLIKYGNEITAIEIKMAKTFNTDWLSPFKTIKGAFQERLAKKYLVYDGDMLGNYYDLEMISIYDATKIIMEIS